MAKNKIYAIYSQKELNIVQTWDECKILTNGVKGKSFKSFSNCEKKELSLWFLEKILKENENIKIERKNELKKLLNLKDNDLEILYKELNSFNNKNNDLEELKLYLEKIGKNNYVAYVDGSYKKETQEYSYGICIVYKDKIVFEDSKKYFDKNGMRQINGELKSTLLACNFAIKNNIKKLYIAYDYQGIESFATGEYKTKNSNIQFYIDTMQRYMKILHIEFVKIPSHKNVLYNERADELSKKVLGINK